MIALPLVAAALAVDDIPTPAAGQAMVCFARPGRLVGAAIPLHVVTDGTVIGALRNRSWFCAAAQPGEYVFTAVGSFVDTSGSYVSSVNGVPIYNPGSGGTNTLTTRHRLTLDVDDLRVVTVRLVQGELEMEEVEVAWLEEAYLREPREQDLPLAGAAIAPRERPALPAPAPAAPAAGPADFELLDDAE